MRKHGLKVLGLTLMAAIGLMAFSATSALAVNLTLGDQFYSNAAGQTPPEFLVNSGTLSPTLLATQAIKGVQIGPGRFGIPKKAAEIVCQKGELTGTAANEYENFTLTKMETGAHVSATLKARECVTESMEAAPPHKLTGKLPNCVPNFDTTPGEIEAKLLLLGKKHEGVSYIVAVPQVASAAKAKENEELKSIFATVKYDINKCAIPTANITGSASFKPPTTDAIKPILKINTLTADTLIGTQLRFGANEAFIETEYEAELTANPGVPFGVM